MANLAAILKSEISRLARRELRGHVEGLKKGVGQQRRVLSNLRKQVTALERELKRLASGVRGVTAAAATASTQTGRVLRFSAKGFKTWRAKSKLSAEQIAKLLDVSAQSVYNWEAKKARPRSAQVAAIAELRALGKRRIMAQLAGLDPESGQRAKGKTGSVARNAGGRAGRKPANDTRSGTARRRRKGRARFASKSAATS